MAESVADLTRPIGPIIWRGTLLKFRDRDDLYVKLTRIGRKQAAIGFSSRELLDLRELIKDLIKVSEGGE